MYESFYNLHPTPFRLTPDPHFFYESDTHKRGLAYLRFAFYQEEGFVVITGAPGTGKTELMLNLITELPRHKVTLAKIVTSNLDADDLLDLIAASFLINPEHLSKGSLLKRLEDYFIHQARNGKHVLLLIDEAHNLSVKSLTELSMLSNFQIDEKPVMQCFLLGQDPLEEKLNIPELMHLKQRVLASTRLESLTQQETREYIMHRLLKSGWDNNPIIRDTAYTLIYYYSQGVPRRINSLCGRVLLQSYLDERRDIGADLVQHVIEELQDELLEHEAAIDPNFAQTQKVFVAPSSPPDNKGIGNNLSINDSGITNNGKPSSLPQSPAGQTVSMDNNSVNIKNIPEFIKKKEINFTRNSAPTSMLISRSNAISTALARDETEPDEISAHVPRMDPVPVNVGSESDLNNIPHVKPSISPIVKDQLLHPTVGKSMHQEQKKRVSGLVDKELQALASLCEAPEFTQSLRTKQNPPAAIKEYSPDATPVKKIIIDDLAYEQFEREGPPDITPDIAGEKPVNAAQEQHWRPPVTVFLILAGMGLSLYWGYDSNTEIVAKNSGGRSISAMSETSVIDLFTPQIQTTLIETTGTPEREHIMEFITAPDAGRITEFTDASPDMVTDSANEPPATTVSAGAASANLPPESGGHTGSDTAAAPNNPRKVKAVASARSPIVGAPLALELNSASHTSPANSQNLGKTDSPSQVTALSDQSVLNTQAASIISGTDLNRLLSTLSIAYENGNLQQLISTFANDIRSSDGTGRQQMENDYRRLFNITDTRQLNIHDISWSQQDKQMLGKGDFQVRVREKGAAKYTTYEGTISLAVAKESNIIVIKQLDYNYNN